MNGRIVVRAWASIQAKVLSILLVVLLPFSVTGEEEPAWKTMGSIHQRGDGPVIKMRP